MRLSDDGATMKARLVIWTAASIALVAGAGADSSAIATLVDMSFVDLGAHDVDSESMW